MSIPTIPQCLALMDDYRMLENIRRHSFVVARVAELLVSEMRRAAGAGAAMPDMDLVLAGALLHDIAKTRCLGSDARHDLEGQKICEEHGFPEIGVIVREHVILSRYEPNRYRSGHFEAREIVYYADKRVRHETIVSLPERLDYIIERYGRGNDRIESRIQENFQTCVDLEQALFAHLDFLPEELAGKVIATPF